jgi:hypothetical protein
VVHAVRPDETGVANAVNSIARSSGQALGSTVAVALLTSSADPATGLPRESAYGLVGLVGLACCAGVALVSASGWSTERRGPDALAGVEAATARAGEWSPVSGLR